MSEAPGLNRVRPDRVRAALAASAALGMFFRLADPADDLAGWRPVESLYSAGAGHLDMLIDTARRGLRDCELRVAASLFFQGYAARLLSPQVGCLVTSGCVPDLTSGRLHWRQPPGGLLELGMTAGPGWAGPAGVLLERVVHASFDHHLRPLADAVRSQARISEVILRDNAASALVGGLRLLDERCAGGWRPLAAAALAQPDLLNSGFLLANEPCFVRRSCCLYYRVPGGGKCGDCPLHPTLRKNALAIGPALCAPKPPPSTITANARSPR